MLVIPTKFREVIKQWLMIKPPRIVRLSTNKCYEFRVWVQNFQGEMVLGRGWPYFYRRHGITPGNLVIMRISGLGLNVQIYNHDSSIMCRACSTKHNCVGDFSQAL